ncbi:MAG TPA: tetratricopeptide repeat protein [Polyangiaceae bacterium]|nr:tetratricopeptide repeat protein [Polyangiaceae bacterium]
MAHAQSAADKATARTLATEGIKLFQAGRYAEALDRLQRAQALYDAPVHLLYIARAQVKLDKLVEGAESYRRLSRVQLDAAAAAAQKQALEAGAQELVELEPKIPALRLDVQPPNVEGLEIRIDGERVPPAIVGVERHANPGMHKVQVWAPGFNAAEADVELKPGERKPVLLQLTPGSGGPPPGVVPSAEQPGQLQPGMAGTPPPGEGAAAGAEKGTTDGKRSSIGFMVGLRLGGAIPLGDVGITPDYDETQPLKDFVEAGGGAEIRGGVRFARYFTGLAYFGRYVMKPGLFWDDSIEALNADVRSDNTASAEEAGIGAMFAFPRGKIGPFVEVDFTLYRRFQVDLDVSAGNLSCDVSWTLTGSGVRAVGGVQIPLAKIFHLSPYVGFTFGKTPDEWKAEWGGDRACRAVDGSAILEDKLPVEDAKSNGLFVIGVGGDFVFGNDGP